MEPERIELSAKERERLKVLHEVEQGHLKQVEAARRLRLTDRQVRRLQRRLRTQGDGGIGGQRGAESPIALPAQGAQRALRPDLGNFPVRAPAAHPMHDPAISLSSQPPLQAPYLAVSQSQTPCRFHLLQMALLDFV